MKSCTGSSWLAVIVLIAGGPLSAATSSWDSLLGNSPFGAAPTGAVQAAAGAPEFRGYFSEGGEQFFSIYDPAQKRSVWLREGQAAAGLRVRGFDAVRQVLAVEAGGQAQTLPLKIAIVGVGPATAPAGAPVASPGPAQVNVPEPVGGGTVELQKAEEGLARARQLAAYGLRRKQVVELRQAKRAAAKPNQP